MNLYAYMGNDLINMVDPTGEFLQTIVCGFVGGNVGLTFDYISKGGNMSGQEMLVSFFGGGTNGSGSIVATHKYGPFGEPIKTSSSRFRYTG